MLVVARVSQKYQPVKSTRWGARLGWEDARLPGSPSAAQPTVFILSFSKAHLSRSL